MADRVHSPSSIKLAKQCRRAWALCYVDRIRKPEVQWEDVLAWQAWRAGELQERPAVEPQGGQRSAACGTRVHLYAEWYLTGAATADADVYGPRRLIDWESLPGQVLSSMLQHLPPAGSVAREDVEREFTIDVDGVPFKGLIDLWVADALEVWDHKTTRDIRQYALLPDAVARELGEPERSVKDDLQACTYVLRRAKDMPGADAVTVRWTYAETDRSRRSLPVVQSIPVAHAQRVCADAANLARTLTYTTSDEAPANGLACDDFGGCWYRGRHCNAKRPWGKIFALHEKEQEKDMAEKKTLSFAELVKKTNAANAEAQKAAAAPVSKPKAEAPQTEADKKKARVAAALKARKAPEPEVEETEDQAEEQEESAPESGEQDTPAPADVANDTGDTTSYGSVMSLIEALQAALPEGVTISVSGKSAA